ncbi:glycosyltransferase family 39 protein [bacterium]|nr:glycosyltransferase family 39 protein [bacterium]
MRINQQRITCSGIIILGLLVCFTGIFDRDLWTPDEPRVAAMSLEMSRNGNYIVPHLAGQPFVEKPPLYYAAAGITIKLLAELTSITGAVRLSTALWGLGVLIFTVLISRHLIGGKSGILSFAILATMAGFVENFHWIRVDAALAFFVIASIWSFIEGFRTDRSWIFLLTGIFTAGAFLSKGFIGPVLISIPFVGMLISEWVYKSGKFCSGRKIFYIFAGIALTVIIIGAWVILFRSRVNTTTWNEWLWVNQFGRFSGGANKGHLYPNNPLYYVKTIAFYCLPWVPFILGYLWTTLKNFKSLCNSKKKNAVFLLIWGIGSCVILSIPATKRSIYLLPVLPVYALMIVSYLNENSAKWIRKYSLFIIALCGFLLGVFTFSPIVTSFFLDSIPKNLQQPFSSHSYRNFLCLGATIICIWTFISLYKKNLTICMSLFISSAMLYLGAFLLPLNAINHGKSLKADTIGFLSQIPIDQRKSIAGWNFSQTTNGVLYFYGDWIIPQIQSTTRLDNIIKNQDEQYESIILNQVHSIPDLIKKPYKLLLKGIPRGSSKYRKLYWIEGRE